MPEVGGVVFSSVFLNKDFPFDPHIDEMVKWGKEFCESGVVQGIEGNLSFRTKFGFIITGTGVALDSLTKDTVVEVRGVVFGLNRPSVYVKGQVVPSMETFLHSGIYEVLPEVNAIFHTHDSAILKAADKLGIPMTSLEQPAGSQELAQEIVNLVKLNKNARCFALKNHGVITLGATMAEAGKLMEDMHAKTQDSGKSEGSRKKKANQIREA